MLVLFFGLGINEFIFSCHWAAYLVNVGLFYVCWKRSCISNIGYIFVMYIFIMFCLYTFFLLLAWKLILFTTLISILVILLFFHKSYYRRPKISLTSNIWECKINAGMWVISWSYKIIRISINRLVGRYISKMYNRFLLYC
jgi:magnesium-transporting ATPase (P-type)